MHLDLADLTDGMQIEYVCRKTEEMSSAAASGRPCDAAFARRQSALRRSDRACLARVGVAVTVLPSTDLYLMGRGHDHAIRAASCAPAAACGGRDLLDFDDNVLNRSRRTATHRSSAWPISIRTCVTSRAQPILPAVRHDHQFIGANHAAVEPRIAEGFPADLVVLDAANPADAIARIAQPL